MRADPLHSSISRAEHLIDLGRYDDAEAVLLDVISQEPEEPRALLMLARCYYVADRYDESVRSAEAAIRVDPNEDAAHRLRALALIQLKKPKEAVRSAHAAIALAPEDEMNHIALTRALILAKDWTRAYAAAYAARELDPHEAEVYSNLGYLSLKRKRWSDAEVYLREALELDPNDADTMNNLGVALGAQKKSTDALSAFATSSRVNPRGAEARHNAVRTARRFGGLGVVLAVWMVFRIVSVGARQGIRTDGSGFALPIVALVLVAAAAVAVLLFWRARRRAHDLDPGLRSFLKEHQLSRLGVGPRAHEYFWGRFAGVGTGLGLVVMGGALVLAGQALGWRIVGVLIAAIGSTLLGFVAVSWRPRRPPTFGRRAPRY